MGSMVILQLFSVFHAQLLWSVLSASTTQPPHRYNAQLALTHSLMESVQLTIISVLIVPQISQMHSSIMEFVLIVTIVVMDVQTQQQFA